MSLLDVQNLQTCFHLRTGKVCAVNGISFYLEEGEALGIVGESGCGKSVTNLSLLKLLPRPPAEITAGRALFQGGDLLQMSEEELRKIRGDKIGMIFQDPMTSLNPFLTIERQMTEVLEVHRKMGRLVARQKAIEMLGHVGIPDPERAVMAYPHQFSGGMRQRAMIATALLCEPSVLIADEPTTALDVTIQAQILDLLNRLRRQFNMGLILITHNLGVVAGVCDRLIVMYAGRIVEEGTAAQIFANPKHPYTKALLKSVPRLDEEKQRSLTPIRHQPPDLTALPSGCHFHPRCDYCEDLCRLEDQALRDWGGGQKAACWKANKIE